MSPRTIIKELKSLLQTARTKQALSRFNQQTNNNIGSSAVSLKAIVGHDITILDGSYLCENSTVDSYSYIGFNSLISKSVIGRYNSIASNVNIGHGEHPIDRISTNGAFMGLTYDLFTQEDCIIEHDVWIGVAAIIRRGVRVGIGSVVGANSFVNKDVPPYAIVAGSPARIIRYRFEQEKIDRILASKWWEHDLVEAQRIINELEGV